MGVTITKNYNKKIVLGDLKIKKLFNNQNRKSSYF